MQAEYARPILAVVLGTVLSVCQATSVQPDKRKHIEAGAAIGAAVAAYAQDYAWGLGMACTAGAAKEFYDYASGPPAQTEMADLLYTCAAGMVSAYSLQRFRVGISGDTPIIGISISW